MEDDAKILFGNLKESMKQHFNEKESCIKKQQFIFNSKEKNRLVSTIEQYNTKQQSLQDSSFDAE